MISATDNDNIGQMSAARNVGLHIRAQISLRDQHMFIALCMNICVVLAIFDNT